MKLTTVSAPIRVSTIVAVCLLSVGPAAQAQEIDQLVSRGEIRQATRFLGEFQPSELETDPAGECDSFRVPLEDSYGFRLLLCRFPREDMATHAFEHYRRIYTAVQDEWVNDFSAFHADLEGIRQLVFAVPHDNIVVVLSCDETLCQQQESLLELAELVAERLIAMLPTPSVAEQEESSEFETTTSEATPSPQATPWAEGAVDYQDGAVGTLGFSSSPPGLVYIDGVNTGHRTPARGIEVEAMYHEVQVYFDAEDEHSEIQTVLVEPQQNTDVFFRLEEPADDEPPSPDLSVTSEDCVSTPDWSGATLDSTISRPDLLGWPGGEPTDIRTMLAETEHGTGLLLVGTMDGTPFSDLGLQDRDMILEVCGRQFGERPDSLFGDPLMSLLVAIEALHRAEMVILRSGEILIMRYEFTD